MKYKVVRMWRNVDVKIERCKISIKTLDGFFFTCHGEKQQKNPNLFFTPRFR